MFVCLLRRCSLRLVAQDAQQKVHENFAGILSIGLTLREDWVISNAAIYTLNYHRALIENGRQYRIIAAAAML